MARFSLIEMYREPCPNPFGYLPAPFINLGTKQHPASGTERVSRCDGCVALLYSVREFSHSRGSLHIIPTPCRKCSARAPGRKSRNGIPGSAFTRMQSRRYIWMMQLIRVQSMKCLSSIPLHPPSTVNPIGLPLYALRGNIGRMARFISIWTTSPSNSWRSTHLESTS